MTRADKLLIAFILLIAVAGYFLVPLLSDEGLEKTNIIIKMKGQVVKTVPIEENKKSAFTLRGDKGPFTVEVDGGRVRMVESTCPDKICVKRGWISNPGETIICVPYEVIIYFDARSPVDAVTG